MGAPAPLGAPDGPAGGGTPAAGAAVMAALGAIAAAVAAAASTFLASLLSHSMNDLSAVDERCALSQSAMPCVESTWRRYSCSASWRARMNSGALLPQYLPGGSAQWSTAAPYCRRTAECSATKSLYRLLTSHRTRRVFAVDPATASVTSKMTSYSMWPRSWTWGFATSASIRLLDIVRQPQRRARKSPGTVAPRFLLRAATSAGAQLPSHAWRCCRAVAMELA